MNAVRKVVCLFALLSTLAAAPAHAWWNAEFKQRTRVTLNTTDKGVPTQEALAGTVIPIRLHSGNFDFIAAKADGSDLRVVAADDKTQLKFWVERFDSTNELGVVWVQLPNVAPGTDKNTVYVYAGHDQAGAEATSPKLFDTATRLVVGFAGKSGEPATDEVGGTASTAPVSLENNGLIGAAGVLQGQALTWSGDTLKSAAPGPHSVSLWIKPASLQGTVFEQGPLKLVMEGGALRATLGSANAAGGNVPASAWTHLAVTVGAGKLTLYVQGNQAAQADLGNTPPAIGGPLSVGAGLTGQVDQIEVADTVRSADWIRFAQAAQGAEARLMLAVAQTQDSAEGGEGGEPGHFAILVDNLTTDAWVVIVILAVMFAIAAWVMYDKAVLVGRADKDNRRFLSAFRDSRDVLDVPVQGMPHSQLARLYLAGMRELHKRDVGKPGVAPLSGPSLNAVRAAIDADLVREGHSLNSRIVLLTIAISGGPFLGLLGTVVGVMITFAAIAAAGDVNVNAIAPGIAAALLATVAGLAVAIPALFGYNYLASRIKSISADMSIFVDEFVTRVAERHGAR